VTISGHHDFLNVFNPGEDIDLGDILKDPAVVRAVRDIRAATGPEERHAAVDDLMWRLG